MTLDEYLVSPDFHLFMDETVRAEAIRAVDTILRRTDPIKRHQLHSLPAVIQGANYAGLAEMAKKQKDKNTNARNKAFWTEMEGILSKTSASDISLFNIVKRKLIELAVIDDEEKFQEKKEKKQIRKRNNSIIESVMDKILSVYVEHFNCHYFYRTQGGKS